MSKGNKNPVVILNILFIAVCLIWGAHHYVSYVKELRDTIMLQDRAINMQQQQIDILARALSSNGSNWNPLYPGGSSRNIYENHSFQDDLPQ